MPELTQKSHRIETVDQQKLHLRQFRADSPRGRVLCVHGAVENAKIFGTESGKGLAPFLAEKGWDTYALDLRGRGASTPALSRKTHFGQNESIRIDLPSAIRWVVEQGEGPLHLIGHSWGGVLAQSMLVRYPEISSRVSSCVYLGTKRSIQTTSLKKLWLIDVMWFRVGPLFAWLHGYLPAPRYGFGSDGETRASLRDSIAWVHPSPWRDTRDGFDYGEAAREVELPPSLWMTGEGDRVLGHFEDMKRFAEEAASENQTLIHVGTSTAALHDYDHISLLTHSDAREDHFVTVANWLDEHSSENRKDNS